MLPLLSNWIKELTQKGKEGKEKKIMLRGTADAYAVSPSLSSTNTPCEGRDSINCTFGMRDAGAT